MVRIVAITIVAGICLAADWPQFRGLNGSGVGSAARLPIEFGPEKNVVWKTPIPFGHSSPVIAGDLIFLTGVEDGVRAGVGNEKDKFVDRGKLYTFAVKRRTGKIAWRRAVPRERQAQYQTNNSPATPSAATDGANAYVFFQDFGFLAYTIGGVERWRLPVGPFNNMNGAGSSPILFRDLLILVCDQDSGSYMLAVDKNTGHVRWKIRRPEATRSYITPAVFQPEHGPAELILPGPYQITSYFAATGEKAWWVRGASWHPKTAPVIDGDVIYAGTAESGGDLEIQNQFPTFAELLAGHDANHDGKLVAPEFADDPKMQKLLPSLDLNVDGFVDENEWNATLQKPT